MNMRRTTPLVYTILVAAVILIGGFTDALIVNFSNSELWSLDSPSTELTESGVSASLATGWCEETVLANSTESSPRNTYVGGDMINLFERINTTTHEIVVWTLNSTLAGIFNTSRFSVSQS
ncbi:MAG: hypothetical protein ACTSPR_01535 [Candidatus Thorarchaeota archaeon]